MRWDLLFGNNRQYDGVTLFLSLLLLLIETKGSRRKAANVCIFFMAFFSFFYFFLSFHSSSEFCFYLTECIHNVLCVFFLLFRALSLSVRVLHRAVSFAFTPHCMSSTSYVSSEKKMQYFVYLSMLLISYLIRRDRFPLTSVYECRSLCSPFAVNATSAQQ